MSDQPITFKQELYRKIFHLSALVIPVAYGFFDKWVMVALLLPVTVICLVLDKMRHTSPGIQKFTHAIFAPIMRGHELDAEHRQLSGASYMMMAASACVLFLPKLIGITAFTVLIISDMAAALIGRKYGKKRFIVKGKTVEGTLAFIISGIVVVFVVGILGNIWESVPWEFYMAGIIGVIFGAYVEAISKQMHWDDNLSIPVTVGGTMLVLGFLTGSYLGL